MRTQQHRSVTVVVGSGGIKPMAAIPFFNFLDDHHILPEMIVACSGGAYVSAFWNAGIRGQALVHVTEDFKHAVIRDKIFSRMDLRTLLAMGNYPGGQFEAGSGLLKSDGLIQFYRKHLGAKQLENLPVPMCIHTTDLDTGDAVPLTSGDLVDAVYASGALYPLLPPMRIHNRWLVDGCYNSSVPLMEGVKRASDVILVLSFEEPNTTSHQSFLEFFFNFSGQIAVQNSKNQLPLAIHLHDSEIIFLRYLFGHTVEIWDVEHIADILDYGKTILAGHQQEILDTLWGEKNT